MTESTRLESLRRIRREYNDLPGLSLTPAQARRLWTLDRASCDELLAQMESEHFLRRTRERRYVRADRD